MVREQPWRKGCDTLMSVSGIAMAFASSTRELPTAYILLRPCPKMEILLWMRLINVAEEGADFEVC